MKPIWKSKTMIVNVVVAAITCLVALQGTELITANPALVAGMATAVAVANIVLRLVTSEPVGLK